MKESNNLSYSLTVEVKRPDGTLKEIRYISHTPKRTVEFIPNNLYLYLLTNNYIKDDTFKIPLILGARKKVTNGNYERI
jgi:hypothetical protein